MKRAFIMLCLIIVVLGSTACSTPSKAPDRDLTPTTPETPTEPEETVFPPVTSKDTELYISRNADGTLRCGRERSWYPTKMHRSLRKLSL